MKIAVHPMDSAGHLNPLLALCMKLRDQGRHEIQFFLATDVYQTELSQLGFQTHLVGEKGEGHTQQSMLEGIPSYEEQDETDKLISDRVLFGYVKLVKLLPNFLDRLKAFQPDLIIYDQFESTASVVAYLLDIPCAAMITFPGFNVYPLLMGRHTEEEKDSAIEEIKASKFLQKYYKIIREEYNFNSLSLYAPLSPFLETGLQICTGIEEFDLEMPQVMKQIFGNMDKECKYVGPMLLTEKEGRISSIDGGSKCEHQWIDEPFPHDELKKYKDQGKKIIYVSFGTVGPGRNWDFFSTPRKRFGARSSGRDFCRPLWQRIFEAFGGNDKYVVVVATISQDPEALKGIEIPSNIIVRRSCPQLEVLKVADAFITHGGFNSMVESISAQVPMLVLPYFGDQFHNGAVVTREGMGLHHNNPVLTCTIEALRSNMETLLTDHDAFASNCKRLQKSLEKAGGSEKACRCIEDYVASFKGHRDKRSLPT